MPILSKKRKCRSLSIEVDIFGLSEIFLCVIYLFNPD